MIACLKMSRKDERLNFWMSTVFSDKLVVSWWGMQVGEFLETIGNTITGNLREGL